MKKNKKEDVKFYFYSLHFKPLAHRKNEYTSRAILKEVCLHLSNIKTQGNALLFDRNENKEKMMPRELFMSSATMMPKDRRIRCTIALIRKGKKPKLMKKGSYNLEDLKKLGDIVEITHFFIDFSKDEGVICMEQNHNGPNIADIEYYLKRVARFELDLALNLDLKIHMENTIESTLENLKNVLSFNIKVKPSNIDLMNEQLGKHYLKSFDVVSSVFKPEFLKIEAFFKKNGKRFKKRKENKMATSMFAKALEVFRDSPNETDLFDNFTVTYENGKGLEDSFNLLKNKKVVVKKVENHEDLTLRKSYELIKNDLNLFVDSI